MQQPIPACLRSPLSQLWPLTILCAISLACLSACRTDAPSSTSTPTTNTPLTREAPAAGKYRIIREQSDIRFLVFRAGALAALGHNHVVQPTQLEGEISVAGDLEHSTLALTIPLTALRVDDPAARATEGEGFDTQPDDEAIAGTRRNMLGAKVLDAEHFPLIEIRSVAVAGTTPAPEVRMRITLHGVAREITVPVVLNFRNGQLLAQAKFGIDQTDFGITPMSVLGGALQVANQVQVKLNLVADKEN